jgi:hypothetical protein
MATAYLETATKQCATAWRNPRALGFDPVVEVRS